jgi:anti-sigma regulatory factor (Ser/Thr protein kinase)
MRRVPQVLLQLQPDLREPARARRWLAEACEVWGCQELAPDALVLVNELTTNVVLHAGTGCLVEADFNDMALLVTVSDERPGDLTVEGATSTGERGRGLHLVDAIADAWGVTPTPSGKSVWFALWAPDADRTPARTGCIAGVSPIDAPDKRSRGSGGDRPRI